MIFEWSDPPEGATVPRVWDTKTQHVLAQLTRLPTTVDHTSCTGDVDDSPVAVRSTLVFTRPLVVERAVCTPLLAESPLA